ncbi:HD domain-containing protein 2 [Balamuthia mandrillaris]
MQASQSAGNDGVAARSGAEGSAAAAGGASGVLEFLRICGALKTTKRTGWVNSEVHLPESISDHMYRMAVISFLFGNEKGSASGLNKEKMIKMALVHDIAEAIVGDITPFDGISKEEKARAEDEAMQAICSKINGPVGEEMYSLFLEYEQSSTPEAKVMHDIDKFEMYLQAFEYERAQGKDLEHFFDSAHRITDPTVKSWVAELTRLRSSEQSASLSAASQNTLSRNNDDERQ